MTDTHLTPRYFLQKYYSALCVSYQNVSPFYTPSSQIAMSHEDESVVPANTGIVERLLHLHHKKKAIKVLVSCYDHHALGKGDHLLAVLGQFVYHDNTTVRFSHTFIVELNGGYIVKNEMLRILDEEVVYKAIDFKEKVVNTSNAIRVVKGSDKNRNKLVIDFSKYGNLVAVEVEESDVLLEYEDEEMVKNLVNDVSFIKSRGYKVEFN